MDRLFEFRELTGCRIKRGCHRRLFKRREFSRSKETVPRLGRHVHARGTNEILEETLKLIVKKFRSSCKVWLTYIRHVTLKGDAEGSRKLLDRATTSLPKRKHIKLLVKVALLEMKEGDPETDAQCLSILRNYPKRTDIWSVYIDQEIKQNIPERIRALFERHALGAEREA